MLQLNIPYAKTRRFHRLPLKNKKEKIGLTPINWLLSILGIIIFASFIILPPLFRVAFKKTKPVESLDEKIVIEGMKCTRNDYTIDNHSETNIIEITYFKDSLRTYKKRTEQTYESAAHYEEEKENQKKLNTGYSLVEGVNEYNVSAKDSDLEIIIEEDYDLSVFKGEKVKLPGSEDIVEVKAVYKLGDSVTGIVSKLSNEGYDCQKSQ